MPRAFTASASAWRRGPSVDSSRSVGRIRAPDLRRSVGEKRPPEPCAQVLIRPGAPTMRWQKTPSPVVTLRPGASRRCRWGGCQPVCGHFSGGGGWTGAFCRCDGREFSARGGVSRGHGFGRGCAGQVRWCSMGHRWDWSGGHTRRPAPARRRVRSSGGPPAPYERGASCPASAMSSPAGALVLGLVTVRRQGTAIVRRSAVVVPFSAGPLGQRSAGDTERGAAGAAATGGLRHAAGMR
jgi:hypothetical protein